MPQGVPNTREGKIRKRAAVLRRSAEAEEDRRQSANVKAQQAIRNRKIVPVKMPTFNLPD